MASTAENAAQKPGQAARRKAMDMFSGGIPVALLALTITALGFWRTFFSQLGQVDAAHMLHGATSTGWLVLILVQSWLIRSRDFKLHRWLGWASVVMFTTLIVTSWHMLVLMLSPGNQLPFFLAKFFAYSDLTALPLMVFAYVGALWWRKDRHVHSRLMVVTVLAGLLPAGGRMYNRLWTGMDGLFLSMHPTYLTMMGVLAVAIYVDWKNQRLRWPFPFAFAWFTAAYATIWFAWQSAWLDALCKAIAGIA